MTFHYSKPFEQLLELSQPDKPLATVRVLIVGSGYGGAVAAFRLAGVARQGADDARARIMCLERGLEYALGEFPTSFDDLPGCVRAVRPGQHRSGVNEDALFDLRIGQGVNVLVGSGLGGTSLINANVAARPTREVLTGAEWPPVLRTEAVDPTSPLTSAYQEVERLLGVTTAPDRVDGLPKFKALHRYAGALGFTAEAAPLTVTFGAPGTQVRNAVGISQAACTGCGNCVTGCNVGAKNTLAMNLIPAAAAAGVEFFTGAQVLDVLSLFDPPPETGPHPRWRVRIRPTVRETRVRYCGSYFIDAEYVVLAAGTLGSTEILQRSASNGLELPGKGNSNRALGKRFSTNGDAVAMSFAERDPVCALGNSDSYHPQNRCGPTITGLAHARTENGEPFLLEEGAIPASLLEVFGELITTGAQLGRIGDNRLPAWFRDSGPGRNADSLSVQHDALERSQLFLVMGNDGATGSIEFESGPERMRDNTTVVPVWPSGVDRGWSKPASGAPSSVLARILGTLAQHDRRDGQNGGQFVHNPLWQFMPPAAAENMSGSFPGGQLISVHPLGGCAMGETGATGVVDDTGNVFKDGGTTRHPGLYVLDGSIVPNALGVNPFLTIAALSWRACNTLLKDLGECPTPIQGVPEPPTRAPETDSGAPAPVRLVVREQLVGQLLKHNPDFERVFNSLKRPGSGPIALDRCYTTAGLILRLTTAPFPIAALENSVAPICIHAELHINPVSAELVRQTHIYGCPPEHIDADTLLASGAGTVTFMRSNSPDGIWERIWRAVLALTAYCSRRQGLGAMIRGFISDKTTTSGSLTGKVQSIWNTICAMGQIASMHGTYRDFDYDIQFDAPSGEVKGSPPETFKLVGRKRLSWRNDSPRLWDAFTHLPAILSFPRLGIEADASFEVDMDYMFDQGLLQVEPGDSVPRGILACNAFALRMARCALQTGFWEFGAPTYPSVPLPPPIALPETIGTKTPLPHTQLQIQVRLSATSDQTITLNLHGYRDTGRAREPVLLIHGLAQGSLIYCHPELQTSMASYLVDRGYDVWLLDYRISNLLTNVSFSGWSIDEIGRYDIPDAINLVLSHYQDGQKLHIFAHCVGSIGLTMGILSGTVKPEQLASVALNAIHPWTIASAANRVRAKLGVFVRDWLNDDFFDPILRTEDGHDATRSLFDRLAFSVARLGESLDGAHKRGDDAHLSNAICDRMTFLYGRMWRHEQVEAVHSYWTDLVGRAPGTVQRHLYYLLLHGRVVDREGQNVYLTESNVANWQGIRTLFFHGEESRVFNPQSATRSAVRLRAVLDYQRHHGGSASIAPPLAGTPIGLRRISKFGHMDVILGKTAPEECFDYLHEFFQGNFDQSLQSANGLKLDPIDDSADTHRFVTGALAAGPVLRGAIADNSGNVTLRWWSELPTDITSHFESLQYRSPAGITRISLNEHHTEYVWDDQLISLGDPLPTNATAVAGGGRIENFLPPGMKTRAPANIQTHPLHMEQLAATAPASATPLTGIDITPRTTEVSRNSPVVTTTTPTIHADSKRPAWLNRLTSKHDDCYFIVGSCRYPGTPFDSSRADEAFDGINKLLDSGINCDLLFLIGDQIYADATAGILDPTSWRDRYLDRYRSFLNAKSVRAALQRIPCHFAIDDHEFTDNYAGCIDSQNADRNPGLLALKSGELAKDQFTFALGAAAQYMGSRRNQPFSDTNCQTSRFWYPLNDAEMTCPAFILDTRSERVRATPLTSRYELMSAGQLNALTEWLISKSEVKAPKFIFLGSPIIPLTRETNAPGVWMRQDGPVGYPSQLSQILRVIFENDIERVVFVGGDPHLSCVAELRVKDDKKELRALHIVSSGLYSPLPFANLNPDTVDWSDSATARWIPIPLAGSFKVDHAVELLAAGEPHFLYVGATPIDRSNGIWNLCVQAYDGSTRTIKTRSYQI